MADWVDVWATASLDCRLGTKTRLYAEQFRAMRRREEAAAAMTV
jgi:hypothetical protein